MCRVEGDKGGQSKEDWDEKKGIVVEGGGVRRGAGGKGGVIIVSKFMREE
jgi:hypothetical protein